MGINVGYMLELLESADWEQLTQLTFGKKKRAGRREASANEARLKARAAERRILEYILRLLF